MSGLLVDVAIYGLAAAFAAPIAAVVSALILGVSKRPVASAWTFVAGAAFLDVSFSAVMLASGLLDVSSDARAWIDTGLGVLFLVMGIERTSRPPRRCLRPEHDAATVEA